MEAILKGAANESPSSTRHEHEDILVERVDSFRQEILGELINSFRQEDIAEQVENDVNAILEKIYEDDEGITLIPRVPQSLRQGRVIRGVYNPQVVSIGPYHWGKPRLEAMEKHKRRYLAEFLKRLPKGLQHYIKEINSLEPQLRSCYQKDIHMSSKNFVEMMLVDGCFVIEFNLQLWESEGNFQGNFLLNQMEHDMLLLENQVPFFLLQRIYDIAITGEKTAYPSAFIQVAVMFCGSLRKLVDHKNLRKENLENLNPITSQSQLPTTIHHFLHLYHSLYISNSFKPNSSSESSCTTMNHHVLDHLTIPSAIELHDFGVKFKIDESPNPFHFEFDQGIMEISPLYLSNWTGSILLNIIMFERFHSKVEPCFIAFFKFFDRLVNTSNDVALLRRYGIIHHEIGSDEELAIFFSQLTKGVLNDPSTSSIEMFQKVNKYCNIKRHRWRASLIRDYCSNPWSTLGLVVGFILLSLTFVQSYMSLHSYFKPHP